MFANFPRTRGQRRGVVLILVLGMLALLALVGVTFATFSGQAKINARNFAQAQNWPDSSEMMDFALAQLIDDTENKMSAIRGHSLKRDMYGSDGLYNAALAAHPTNGSPFVINTVTAIPANSTLTIPTVEVDGSPKYVSVAGLYKCVTNIQVNDPAFYGYYFTRWIMRFAPQWTNTTPPTYLVGQTFEILAEDLTDTSVTPPVRCFYLAPWDSSYAMPANQPTLPPALASQEDPTHIEAPTNYNLAPTIPYPLPTSYATANQSPAPVPYYASPETPGGTVAQSTLINSGFGIPGTQFTLDGRFLHAFNGPGMDGLFAGASQYANFRVNGNILNGNAFLASPVTTSAYGFPNSICGMDEDYDACDLENWFLAMQSADGQVVIPSFHRPGILTYDPTVNDPITKKPPFDDWTSQNIFSASKILRPRAADGHSSTSFPDLHPIPNGHINYDVDNDGDGTTDSVWLDLGYPAKRNAQGQLFKPLFAFMVIGLNGRIPLNTAGNLQLRDLSGAPLAQHASGKGFSPSEIDPSFALQNAFATGYSQVDNAGAVVSPPTGIPGDNTGPANYTYAPPWGTAGVPVSVTQLRNILAGMRTQSPALFNAGVTPANGDANWVFVNNQAWFMPNGVADTADLSNPVSTTTPPIPGRWGEADELPAVLNGAYLPYPGVTNPTPPWPPAPPIYTYQNAVRAGLSGRVIGTANLYGDARDDNFNAFDWYPSQAQASGTDGPYYNTNSPFAANPPGLLVTPRGEGGVGLTADYYDASGSLSLPVERIRRFVTPIDVMGDGLVNNYKTPVAAVAGFTPLLGSDEYGRVAYVKHFRPAGLPDGTWPGSILPKPLPLSANPPPKNTVNATWYPYGNVNAASPTMPQWMSFMGSPVPMDPTTAFPVDRTNNIYHGYEWYRNMTPPTALVTANIYAQFLLGGMMYNNVLPWAATPPQSFPSYDQYVNSVFQPNATTVTNAANLNEADEMQVYQPAPFDAPYGPSDLEWLYRQQDTDGVSLSSRLSELAKISFTNPADGMRRRRLFSVETWDPTTFVWANDTPRNDPQFNVASSNNSTFGALVNANLSNKTLLSSSAAPLVSVPLPPIAQRDRRINLNFPLPVSNRYDEPVRQKWIRETYQLLKQILPPKAVDTPEELAQLSQYVVNIIDFRDPDSTCTRFVNTDVYYATKPTPTAPATLTTVATSGLPTLPPGGNLTGLTHLPPPYSPLYDNGNSPYLVQFGMEYNPVAITEVLAFQQQYKNGGAPTTVNRMFIELLNTLTSPAGNATTVTQSTACDLELEGWDFVILPDDPTGRPDPYTGQIPFGVTGNSTPTSVQGSTLSNVALPSTGPMSVDPGGMANPIKAIDASDTANPRPFVFMAYSPSGLTPAALNDNNAPSILSRPTRTAQIDNLLASATSPLNPTLTPFPQVNGKFYWLYLRRPANPFDLNYDSARPNENRVVVDCFRFNFNGSRVTSNTSGMMDTATPTPVAGDVYSLRRLQPFRGGHAVPLAGGNPAATPKYCIPAYGYSEQTQWDTYTGTTPWQGRYGTANTTGDIWNSLGTVSRANGGANPYDDWDHLVFNDRDFTSVAELLLVPGCPPGLFTKQFIEFAPPLKNTSTPYTAFTAPGQHPSQSAALGSPEKSAPATFPYLIDDFFYTAQSEPTFALAATVQPTANPAVLPSFTPPSFVDPGGTIFSASVWPDPGVGPAPTTTDPNHGGVLSPTYPITPNPLAVPSFPGYVGGPSGAGWYKMLEFFEVPSPANGSIAPVSHGSNYDWARQDLKPGLLNLNLIIDEEVFFALMSESWLKTLGYVPSWTSPAYSPSQQDVDNMGDTRLNVRQVPASVTPAPVVPTSLTPPWIVTQVNASGFPRATYPMQNQGFLALDPVASLANGKPTFDNRMKVAFADFLKLRHGGSGYMFAHGQGNVGDPNTAVPTTRVASERPFHSLSYPDINYTVMRPAALPPTGSTFLTPWMDDFNDWYNGGNGTSAATGAPLPPWLPAHGSDTSLPFKIYVGDPGIKNPYLYTSNNPPAPPPIPARRLFEVPDVWGFLNQGFVFGSAPTVYDNWGFPKATNLPRPTGTPPPGTPQPAVLPSNASSAESTYPQAWWNSPAPSVNWITFTGDPNVNWQNLNGNLANPDIDLSTYPSQILTGLPAPPPYPTPVVVPSHYLGANSDNINATPSQLDNREHPLYRYEWLQKMTNLTTVRTHQYAVWITVGFFEVTVEGDPSLGMTYPSQAYDRLGAELNIQNGRNVRYRSFFIIDRTRAVGFSPQAPGNFRDCVVYRQLIE